MENSIEIKLIDCLDALDAGEPISQILARYPADAAMLRPMLETAAALPALALEPSASAQISSRRAFLNGAAALRPASGRRFLGLPLRMGLALASLLLAVAVAGGGTVTASSAALPGEPLYGIKRAAEQVKIALTSDKVQLEREIAQRRRDEIVSLIVQDRSANVEFSGTVAARSANTLRVTGLTVQINPDTRIDGDPYVGALVTVAGRLVGGSIQATRIEVLPGGALVPTATHASSVTASDTATAKPTASRTPQPTLTYTAEPTDTAIPEPTDAPTAAPQLSLIHI